MTKRKSLFLLPLLLALTAWASAVPDAVNFQGRFNIYDSDVGGAKLWGPFVMDGGAGKILGHGEIPMVMGDGKFNVILGPQDTGGKVIGEAFNGDTAYIEMKVGSDAPFPRQPFRSAPYAFRLPNINPKQNGYVGIGTVNPSAALEVMGTLYARTDLRTPGAVSCTNLVCNGPVMGIGNFPIGSIVAWDKNFIAGTGVTLPSQWAECDGTAIHDSESPLNNQLKPNLNNPAASGVKGYYLRGHTSSGVTQTDLFLSHTHSFTDGIFSPTSDQWMMLATGQTYKTGSQGTHTVLTTGDYVGEETRPQTYTVVWIIRIK
ncbi:MAG: hypothetical protein NTX50_01780 [Candidatus Sumerlaeota bacterium]|nr:hypothetical protein [Candidatus Sumerlaeota bacterium]